MNNQIMELTKKVLEANDLNTKYNFHMEFDDGGFKVFVTIYHTQLMFCVFKKIGWYDFCSPRTMENELDYTIAQLENFIRYKDFPNAVRLALAEDMKKQDMKKNKQVNGLEIADYFDLSPEVGEMLNNGSTPKAV